MIIKIMVVVSLVFGIVGCAKREVQKDFEVLEEINTPTRQFKKSVDCESHTLIFYRGADGITSQPAPLNVINKYCN